MSALISLGAIDDANVVDLFAGSGALGIECLSRGAAHATFVDNDRAALAALRTNLVTTGFAPQSTVISSDVLTWVGRAISTISGSLVFADPPYAFTEWPQLLESLGQAGASLIVAERGSRSALLGADAASWTVIREAKYASAIITFLVPSSLA